MLLKDDLLRLGKFYQIVPMSNLSWNQFQLICKQNNHRSATLVPYSVAETVKPVDDIPVAETEWVKQPVSPATPLSAILLCQDALYQATPIHGRPAILRDETTDCQEKAAIHLKGRDFPARKTAEAIALAGLEEGRASTWSDLGWRTISILRECQLIVVNETKQTVKFYPEDVTTWSNEFPCYIIDFEARFIWTWKGKATASLTKWIADKETDGWTFDWPLAEGPMTELKEMAINYGLSTTKVKKELLQKQIGRSQSLKHFSTFSFDQ